jgi:hypothetical protein
MKRWPISLPCGFLVCIGLASTGAEDVTMTASPYPL